MKKLYTQKKYFLLAAFLFLATISHAQLTVDSTLTPTQLVNTILGPGVTATNITFTGTNSATGEFWEPSNSFGMTHGILLTTGSVNLTPGPNLVPDMGQDNLLPGDAQLDAYSGSITNDATILEFDFTCSTDTLQMNFVFASEEYNEFVGLGFNDICAFFLSGPGIAGQENIALVPATTMPVSIDSINNGYNLAQSTGPCFNCQYYVDNYTGSILEYDGYTTVLTAKGAVQPGSTYHLRIAIADATDGIYDSGVFLQANSVSASTGLYVSTTGATICGGDCATIEATYSGGTPPYTFLWTNGLPNSPGPFFVCPTTTTTYTVSIIDSSGNFTSDTALVVVNAAAVVPSITQSGDTLFAPQGYASYQWYFGSDTISGANNYFYVATLSGNYNLVVGNSSGCDAGAGILNVIAGISSEIKTSASEIIISKNHQLIITTSNLKPKTGNKFFLIHDMTGKLILVRAIHESPQRIDISEWRSGIYFYEMINDESRSAGKFMVE